MSGDVIGSPPAATGRRPEPPVPGNRMRPGLIVAVAVAVLMAFGIGGLVGAALIADDDIDPTGNGLRPTVNVDQPATAPDAAATDEAASTQPAATGGETQPESASASESASGADAAASSSPPAETAAGGDDFSGEAPPASATLPPMTTAVAVNDIEAPSDDQLPVPGSAPVEFPALVTNPAPPSTYAIVALGELQPGAVPELDGWTVVDRRADRLSLTDGDQVIEIFLLDGVANADDALERFYDRVRPDLEEMTRSPIARLGAPNSRFDSVAGSEFAATIAGQQGTSMMSGAIVAGVRSDASAVVIASSRAGTSSTDDLAGDGVLLRAILARL